MNEEVKIKAWMARDEDNDLCVYFDRRPRKDEGGYWKNSTWELYGHYHQIPEESFPEVQWSDPEPTEVELTIKIKEQ